MERYTEAHREIGGQKERKKHTNAERSEHKRTEREIERDRWDTCRETGTLREIQNKRKGMENWRNRKREISFRKSRKNREKDK